MTDAVLLEDRPAARQANAPGRALVKSFGCQMNVYDSQRMADLAASEGFAEAQGAEDADLIVLNTCHIRERAAEKIYSELGKLRDLKEERRSQGRRTTLVVAGCLAQAEGAEILRRQPAVDIVVGPQSYHRLPDLIRRARERPGIVDTEFPADDKFGHLPAAPVETIAKRGPAAYVTVQEGCDKFCAFCVVPYTRGAEVSRPAAAILGELAHLARAGVREATLIGQNVNAYHDAAAADGPLTLAGLIRRAAAIPGIERLRYATSHPNDMGDDLIAAHAEIPALAPYMHLPIQSGSDRILAAMNRRHGIAAYLDIVRKVRAARPDIAFSSDFIVGFPGETESDFADTVALAREVGYASSYAFKYSARPGTPAAEAPGQIDDSVKTDRLARLQSVLEASRLAFNETSVGRRFDVLFDKPGRRKTQAIGRSPYMQSVWVEDAAALIGRMATVEIVSAGPNSLHGRLVSNLSQTQA